jgi:hypothetical protein
MTSTDIPTLTAITKTPIIKPIVTTLVDARAPKAKLC